MKIAITGASGFTGLHACKHFSNKGFEVFAIVRKSPERKNYDRSIRLIHCDLTDKSQIYCVFRKISPDYVLHLAGRNAVDDSWNNPVAHMETNLLSTVYLLDALRSQPACRILVVSSMLYFPLTECPEPPHPYSLSKTLQSVASLAWRHLFKQQIMIARPVNLIGPGRSNGVCGLLAKKIVNQEKGIDLRPFRLSSLTETRDFLDVRDAVAAYAAILQYGSEGTVYPVGSGRLFSLGDVLRTFQKLSARELAYEVGDVRHPPAPNPLDLAAVTALGWKPSIPFEQSLQEVLQFYRGRPGQD